jgi:hypothetical protein
MTRQKRADAALLMFVDHCETELGGAHGIAAVRDDPVAPDTDNLLPFASTEGDHQSYVVHEIEIREQRQILVGESLFRPSDRPVSPS